jgi:FKBP-type peptidyl-prolyl cis-trans isomerase (trigger factor)
MPIKVNGKEISENAVRYELQRLGQFYGQDTQPEDLGGMLGELRKKAEEQAIGMELLMQDVQSRGIEVPESEIDKAIEEMILQTGGQEEYEKIMEQQSLTDDMVRESVRNGRKIDMFIAELTKDIPEPTDEDLKEFFEKDPEQYSNPERRAAQHILIKPNSESDDDKASARDKLKTLTAPAARARAAAWAG